MRNRRPRTALVLVAMGVVLLVSIAVGQQIGERTIFGATERRVEIPEQIVTPVPEDVPEPNEEIARNWKRLQVVSVATDPAFPDPRVTPPPTPTPRPTPTPKPYVPPTLRPDELYTSPPLPLPLVTHEPGASPEP